MITFLSTRQTYLRKYMHTYGNSTLLDSISTDFMSIQTHVFKLQDVLNLINRNNCNKN